MLNQEELKKLEEELARRREELMAKIQKNSEPHNAANEVVKSGEEEADEAEDFSNQLAIVQTFRDEVQEIDTAMERIRKGEYGKCMNCGGEIPKEVLAAAPESVLCDNCKRQA